MSAPDDSSQTDAPEIDEALSDEEVAEVDKERDRLKTFVLDLTPAQIKNGEWFAKLLTVSVAGYTQKVDWAYFQDKYPGVPRDAVVDQRIKLAARYASIEGGLSAGAYTGVIVATLGTAGGASPVTVPAAVATLMVDVAYITQLQLRLAYDIAVLYGISINMNDPEDLWKLIRVAFTIKGGEALREGVVKAVPALVKVHEDWAQYGERIDADVSMRTFHCDRVLIPSVFPLKSTTDHPRSEARDAIRGLRSATRRVGVHRGSRDSLAS